jgi:hypothetical protein
MTHGRDDIRSECAGIIAGAWFAGIGKRGEELIAAGLLMLAGAVDLDDLDKCGLDGSGDAEHPSHTRTAKPSADPGPES